MRACEQSNNRTNRLSRVNVGEIARLLRKQSFELGLVTGAFRAKLFEFLLLLSFEFLQLGFLVFWRPCDMRALVLALVLAGQGAIAQQPTRELVLLCVLQLLQVLLFKRHGPPQRVDGGAERLFQVACLGLRNTQNTHTHTKRFI